MINDSWRLQACALIHDVNASQLTGGSETRFAAMCALSCAWSNSATSCSRPMKLLHYVSQAPHTNICNSIMHKDLQNAAISLNESNSWRRLTTKDQKWPWLQIEAFDRKPGFSSPCELSGASHRSSEHLTDVVARSIIRCAARHSNASRYKLARYVEVLR